MKSAILLKVVMLFVAGFCLWFLWLDAANSNPKGFKQKAVETVRFFSLILTGAGLLFLVLHFGTPMM